MQHRSPNVRRFAMALLACAASALAPCGARAQSTYPDRPIRIVSPFVAGSVSDICLRVLSDTIAAKSGIGFIIQNQVGAGGISAASTVKSAPADGYSTALFSNATAVSVSLFNSLPFDPLTDFLPVGGISEFSYILAVAGGSKFNSAQELFDAMRARPGALNIGTSGIGTTPHLAAALLKSELRLDATLIPYRGSGEQFLALSRGDVDVIVDTYAPLQQALSDGRVRAIAVTSAERAPVLPQTRALGESGAPGFDVSSWNGLYVPKGTPADRIDFLRAQLATALADEPLRTRFKSLGAVARASSAEELDARMKSEIAKWSKVIAAAGIEKQ